MKSRILFSVLAVLLAAATVLTINSCKKDEDEQPEPDNPPTYTDGQGEIGSIGGTVMVDDNTSPINGASIEIPAGALEENVIISIEQPDSNYYINGSSDNIVIDILPSGIQFDKPVKIGIPYSDFSDEQYFKAFYYNPEEGSLEELNPVSIDKTNKIFYCETEHTSPYTCDEVKMDIELVKVNDGGTTRIGVFANIRTPFENIPTRWGYSWNGYPDAYSILYSSYVLGVGSNYEVRLFEKGSNTAVGEIELEVWINQTSSGNDIGAVQVGDWTSSSYESIYQKEFLQKEYIANTWMSGFPLLFTFKNFTPDDSKEYYAKVTWLEEKRNQSGYMANTFTDFYTLGKKSGAKELSDLSWEDGDADLNYILDEYEGGGGNQPPYDPTNESPDHEATNVSINTNLSWTCTDPDGDDLDYDIYFGTSSNPPLEEEYYTSTSWNPGTLEENTTYYWKIKAFEVGNDDHFSESPVWEFTTGDGGGDIYPPVVDILEPEPNSTVEGNVAIIVRAIDNVGVNRVEFEVYEDGQYVSIGTEYDPYTGDNYRVYWNTEDFSNGDHNIHATAYDDAGNEETAGIGVNVYNGGGGSGTFTDPRDGQVYEYVEIGSQTWMAENLNYETGNSWCYDNDPSNCATYGRLYDWSTALGACPSGWHLPSDGEWCTLTTYIDPTVDCDAVGYSGTDAGYKMKSTSGWYSNGNGSDAYGFAALPGGIRYYDGSFRGVEKNAYFWSSTGSGASAWSRYLLYGYGGVLRNNYTQVLGFSVRCLKD